MTHEHPRGDGWVPIPPKHYLMAVEFIAEQQGTTLAHVYEEALDALIRDHRLDQAELEDWARRTGRM